MARATRRWPWWAPFLASLVPWLAFMAPLAGHALLERRDLDGVGLGGGFYLALVALPSALPIAVACSGRVRLVVLVVLSGVAVHASWFILTSESSTAGLAVFEVPYVALPLAVVLRVADLVGRRLGPGTTGSG